MGQHYMSTNNFGMNYIDYINYREPNTGEECYNLWLSRVNNGLAVRQQMYDPKWDRWLRMYKGDHWRNNSEIDIFVDSDNVREKVTVNITASIVDDTLTFLVRNNPKFTAKATREE